MGHWKLHDLPPKLRAQAERQLAARPLEEQPVVTTQHPKAPKPLLNKLESAWLAWFKATHAEVVLTQAITLRLDPPFTSYRPDFAYMDLSHGELVLVEVKGQHRFREKGIAKVALAAKTYPLFTFVLYERVDGYWKSTVMSK